MTGNDEKASRYIALLETARVNGSWSELPELIRKVNKHAPPQRRALIQTATAEYEVATARPSTSQRSATEGSSISTSLAPLTTIVQSQNAADEESIQAGTCLLWARWSGLDSQASRSAAGPDISTVMQSTRGKNLSTWTKICIVKSAYFEGLAHIRNGQEAEGKRTFTAAVDYMQSDRDQVLSIPQLAYWSEQLLAQLVAASTRASQSRPVTMDTARLEASRYWAVLASKTKDVPASTYGNSATHISRSELWQSYYGYLSALLQSGAFDGPSVTSATRLQQSTELLKIERSYENELLRTHKFPKATESNEVMEHWVEQVIANWQVLCGPHWRDADIGQGGRDAVSRTTLDILYRAATKTFHSTLILRRLFQVHKSLAEFDLAYRAFDQYLEQAEKARKRAQKSGQLEPGQESEESILLTTAEAVEGLCSFGRQSEARKAYELCLKLEDSLSNLGIEVPDQTGPNGNLQNGHTNHDSDQLTLEPATLETIYRSIGIGKAHWARWTPFSESRSELQEEALTALREACSQRPSELLQIETVYALGLLLAETREITEAILYVKRVLARSTSNPDKSMQWASERQIIPLWHLLSLLLSSRQEFDSAVRSCVAAFEQLPESTVLFGTKPATSAEKSETGTAGLVTDLECDELQKMLEVRITELSLTELLDGPEEAVNCSNELLSLFSQLFAHLHVTLDSPIPVKTTVPPKSSAGTISSNRGSVFGRRKHNSSVEAVSEKVQDNTSLFSSTTRPNTSATQAPTIQITDENSESSPNKHHTHLFRHSHEKSRENRKSTDSSSLRKMLPKHGHKNQTEGTNSTYQTQPPDYISAKQDPLTLRANDPATNNTITIPTIEEVPTPSLPIEHDASTESRQELPEIGHNLPDNQIPLPAAHDQQPPRQDVRLPTLHPYTNATSPPPRFSKTAAQKHALTVLTNIWLVIAALYRRANMFDDSKEACEEAGKAATKIESIVSAVEHTARSFADSGWGGGGKSVDEVWADVYCERAQLQLALYNHALEKRQGIPTNEGLLTAVEEFEQCLMCFPNHTGGIIGLSNVLLDYFEKKVDLARRLDDGDAIIEAARSSSTISQGPQLQQQLTALNLPAGTREGLLNGINLPVGSSQPAPSHGNINPSTNMPASSAWQTTQPFPTISTTLAIPSLPSRAPTSTSITSAAVLSSAASTTNTISGTNPPQQTLTNNNLSNPNNPVTTNTDDDLKKTPENLNRTAARDRAYGLLSTLTRLGTGYDNSEAWFALARAHELGGEIEKAKNILWWCVELEDSRPVRGWGCLGYVI